MLFMALLTKGQSTNNAKAFNRSDSLRGSMNEERSWWDVQHYTVSVEPDYLKRSIQGRAAIRFKALSTGNRMQIDLQQPMNISSAMLHGKQLPFERENNVYHIALGQDIPKGAEATLTIQFSGNVTVAKRAPWDGGWIFTKDEKGNPWMSVACQGLGASVWYPCKDHQSDEPDKGAQLNITVPDSLVAVGNGKWKGKQSQGGKTTYTWEVTNPINNYNIVPYIGKYVSFGETYQGEKGALECSYWVLEHHLEKAKKQFTQVRTMLKAFEHWFGPYPFYEDGYKLVDAPHLGMEHQSAIAYGNGYMNGYRGKDLSGSGHGLDWDFIIIHESGHEWFGNNITTKDIADMWVHEGFTNYSETLFTDFVSGKNAGDAYLQGTRALIVNQSPVIGSYGVNEKGSGDMYYKGGNLIHYIRQLMKDDEKFRMALREMNKRFYHTTTTSAAVETFWNEKAGMDLRPLFDQYLRDTRVPVLEVKKERYGLQYRWAECLDSFTAPVLLHINGEQVWVVPTTTWKKRNWKEKIDRFEPDKNFYIGYRPVN